MKNVDLNNANGNGSLQGIENLEGNKEALENPGPDRLKIKIQLIIDDGQRTLLIYSACSFLWR